MGKRVLKVERKSAEEIKEILNSNPDFLLATRLGMVYQVAKGHSSREVAKWHGVSFKQVVNWVHRFEEKGLEGLQNREGRGRKPYLTEGDLIKLKHVILKKKPVDFGINKEKWSGPILLKLIKKEYDIDYRPTQAYKLIEKMNLRFQKGKGITIGD